MAKKCSVEGCEFTVFGKGYCKFHYPKKPLSKKKSSISKISAKGIIKKEKKKEYTKKQWELFIEIWNEREHVCFETGKKLYGEPLSTMFHHCLYKSIYPEYALIKENIVILHPDVHNQVHSDDSKTPKVKEYTKKLKEKYGKN